MDSSNLAAPWERIQSENFVFESGCWKTCSGFCCSNGHPDFNFRLMPMKSGTTILYMGPEYRWMRKNGKVLKDHSGREIAAQRTFDFGGPKPLSFFHATCNLLGQCDGVVDKPFLCKIYPFFPILSLDGILEDIYPSSIFELTFELKKTPTPCTVSSKTKAYLDEWQKKQATLESLKHPTIIFYLRSAKHFMDNYSKQFQTNAKLATLSGKAFWEAWEMEYLSGKLIGAPELKEVILRDYNAIVERYGQFEI